MADYGVYTLLDIYNRIYGGVPTINPQYELAGMREVAERLGGIPTSRSMQSYYLPNDFFKETVRESVKSLTVPSADASSAWTAYKEAGNAINQLGSATQGSQMVKSATTGYYRFPDPQSPTGYQYKIGAMLNMSLPTAAAAIAPLAGVAIGATMYQENPELWTKLSRALIPWAYPDGPDGSPPVDFSKGLMPVWTEVGEAAGELIARALLPATLVDAIKGLFHDEGIGGNPGVSSDLDLSPVQQPLGFGGYWENYYNARTIEQYTVSENAVAILDPTRVKIFVASTTQNEVIEYARRYNTFTQETVSLTLPCTSSYTYDGRTVWYSVGAPGLYQSRNWNIPNTITTNLSTSLYGPIAWTLLYGTVSGEYPEGTSQWGDGSVYPLPSNPTQIVTQDENGDYHYIDAYPVPLPLTPGQSTDPTIQGIDDPLVDISKQVDPYIQPTPEPYSEPSPTPENPNQPGPEQDPSREGEPDGPISPDSPTPTPPPSDGQSPDPTPPIIPPPFTSEGGLIAVYNPPQSTLVAFANWLWVTYQDATIQKIWNNPFDGVISLHELYCTPPVIGTRNIKSGFLDSEISSPIIGRYTEINCGSIVIPEYWGNYLDYAPYTKAFVYLPFIGIIELEADDIVGHSVNITYRIDCYNGSCIALITVAKQGPDGEIYNNTVYQYSGNCAVELPLTGGSQANIKAAIINATAWGLGSVISGLVTAAGTGPIAGLAGAGQAISGALQATASVVNAKSSVQHSGTFGASFGAMGIKIPYIIIKRPIQVQVLNYNEIYGYQAHKAVTIGSCEGYLRCREVHVTSATANDEEKQLIEQYLKTGVIV